jgi:hypothetical protein
MDKIEILLKENSHLLSFKDLLHINKLLKESDFNRALELLEANVDGTNLNSATTGSSGTTAKPVTPISAEQNSVNKDKELTLTDIERRFEEKEHIKLKDKSGKEYEGEVVKDDGKNLTLKDKLNKVYVVSKETVKDAHSAGSHIKDKFLQGYNSVNLENIDYQLEEEIRSIKQLAGLKPAVETTSAASVSAGPTVVGNTSKSHLPTSKLAHELRQERVAKERKKENKYKKD